MVVRKRHQDKNETRARALATHDRKYWVRLLETVDTWFPVFRVRHQDADRAQVVAHLASLIDKHRRRGFADHEHPSPPSIPETAVFFESPLARRAIIPDTTFGTTSGVVKANAFKLFNIETASKSDTLDLHTFNPVGTSDDTNSVLFWVGFQRLDSTRLDSTWDQIDIFSGSPSDRVVHMAVLRVDLPRPTTRVIATLRTSMFITLAQGVEIINDWGFFDDEDSAVLRIDFCGAFTRDGAGFPDPSAFGFTSAFSFGSSTHKSLGQDADMSRTVVLSPSDKPSLFLGMRWTFAGADSRMQTGFTQDALTSIFGFQRPDTGFPGVLFSYEPELVFEQ